MLSGKTIPKMPGWIREDELKSSDSLDILRWTGKLDQHLSSYLMEESLDIITGWSLMYVGLRDHWQRNFGEGDGSFNLFHCEADAQPHVQRGGSEFMVLAAPRC